MRTRTALLFGFLLAAAASYAGDHADDDGDQDACSYRYHVTAADSRDGYVFGSFLAPVAGSVPPPQWFSMSTSGRRHYGSRYVDVAVEAAGNVYAVGTFGGAGISFSKDVSFNQGARNLGAVVVWYAPGGSTLRASGLADEMGNDAYFNDAAPTPDGGVCTVGTGPKGAILKECDASAQPVWELTLQNVTPDGRAADSGEIAAVCSDANGNVYTAGSTTVTDVADYGVLVKL